jgi:hypothetical protein
VWNHSDGESEHVAVVKRKYAELRPAFDAIDDPVVASSALAVRLDTWPNEQPIQKCLGAHQISAKYAGIGENDAAATT